MDDELVRSIEELCYTEQSMSQLWQRVADIIYHSSTSIVGVIIWDSDKLDSESIAKAELASRGISSLEIMEQTRGPDKNPLLLEGSPYAEMIEIAGKGEGSDQKPIVWLEITFDPHSFVHEGIERLEKVAERIGEILSDNPPRK